MDTIFIRRIKLKKKETMKNIRKPAVAGQFYPADPEKLKKEIAELSKSSVRKIHSNVCAIISPHAGYVFSGGVAASAFNQAEKSYKKVFVIGTSHRVSFNGASLFTEGDFLMPYGKENIDYEVARSLAESHPGLFTPDSSPHLYEHSLEVQLPFIYHRLSPGYSIVPVIIATQRAETCKSIAEALIPWFTPENLFVISTDFSHYPASQEAKRSDTIVKDAIISNDPEEFLQTLKNIKQEKIPGLSTPICGWSSVLTLLYLTCGMDGLKYDAVDYINSGDVPYYGDKERVVGYWAIVAYRSNLSAE